MDFARLRRLEIEHGGSLYALQFDELEVSFIRDDETIFELARDEAEILAAALRYVFKPKMFKKENTGKENSGQPWTKDLDAECIKLWQQNKSVSVIAKHFKRSPGAIRSRLLKLGEIT